MSQRGPMYPNNYGPAVPNAPVQGPYPSRAQFQPQANTYYTPDGLPMDPSCFPGLPRQEMPVAGPLAVGFTPTVDQPTAQLVVPETAPDKLITLPGVSALTPGSTGQELPLQWNDDGYCLGIKLGIRTGAANLASLGVRIQVGGEQGYITSNGLSADFVLASDFSGTLAEVWLPFYRPIVRNEVWNITFRSYVTADTNITPSITFKFRSLRSLR